jgi:hypothetical protein
MAVIQPRCAIGQALTAIANDFAGGPGNASFAIVALAFRQTSRTENLGILVVILLKIGVGDLFFAVDAFPKAAVFLDD